MRRWAAAARIAGASLVLAACLGAAGPTRSCSGCLATDAADCPACPTEIQTLLEGKRIPTRRSGSLENDCLALEPVHPMVSPENQHLLSKPLDRAEIATVRRYGYRRVRVLPGCAALGLTMPEFALLARPLAPEDRVRDDGSPKPTVYVDRNHGRCVARGSAAAISSPASPACELRTAIRATRDGGGAIIEIAGGDYSEPGRIRLGHGQVLVARADETVTLSGWIDVSNGTAPNRSWVKASEDPTGALWAVDWSDHADGGGAKGLQLPLTLDGRKLAMATHFEERTRASDVDEIVLTRHDVESAGASPIYFYANPDHPAACMHSGVNAKSQTLSCELDGRRLPCSECGKQKRPVRPRSLEGGVCRSRPGTCSPAFNWQTSKRTALDLCRTVLGNGVSKCVLLKLPRGHAPQDHRIRSSHTNHGFHLYNDEDTFASGVVLRGLRLENMPVTAWGARRITARSGKTLRLDAVELDASPVSFLGGHMTLENSYGHGSKLYVSGSSQGLSEVVVRNNFLDRHHGKPISWGESAAAIPRSPRRLHDLAPLCDGSLCAEAGAPTLFSGEEGFAEWRGWNKILFNVVRNGAAINAFRSMSYTVVVGNSFEKGGIQEGILDLAFGAQHVLVHHNWSRDGLGTGIKILGSAVDLVISDNQLHRSPGDPEAGAGPEDGAGACDELPNGCWGAHRSILLKSGEAVCREVTVENNLSSGSRHGGFAFQACDQLTVRNNTAARSQRLPELLLFASPVARGPARIVDNVASDASPAGEAAASLQIGPGRHPFRVGESGGNFFQGCAADGAGCPASRHGGVPLKSDAGWNATPRYADPESDDFHLIGGWDRADRCEAVPTPRYAHPGFSYSGERCTSPPGSLAE